jgi:hypothetical protein
MHFAEYFKHPLCVATLAHLLAKRKIHLSVWGIHVEQRTKSLLKKASLAFGEIFRQ